MDTDGAADTMTIYYQGVLLLRTNFAGVQSFQVPFGPGTAAAVTIIMDEGQSSGSVWSYTASITGNNVATVRTGRIVAGGDFTQINSAPRNHIAILGLDGTVDAGFDPAVYADNAVLALALYTNSALPDLAGKMMAGGSFSAIAGVGLNRLARLNEDATVDASFNAGLGPDGAVNALALLSDGRVLAAGSFINFNGVARNHLARINLDGTLDAGYLPGAGLNDVVWALTLQDDGRLLVGGAFTTARGAVRNRIARLQPDGTIDASCNPGVGPDGAGRAMAVQTNGQIVIAGDFTSVDGVTLPHIARLNADGSLDGAFNPRFGANTVINALVIQSDGKIVIGGAFTLFDTNVANRIARLNGDGSFDATFNPGGVGVDGYVSSMAVQADGKLLIGGEFTSYKG
ncbi:MAG: delta-60 repeat domain-containing protein, partial [Verrucomicrobia bacterium]|nr:delta-60 repeat domain-containing protein [Verrucomicrobiota bacterium]